MLPVDGAVAGALPSWLHCGVPAYRIWVVRCSTLGEKGSSRCGTPWSKDVDQQRCMAVLREQREGFEADAGALPNWLHCVVSA